MIAATDQEVPAMASIRPYETDRGRRYLVRYRDEAGREQSKAFDRKRDADRFADDVERRKRLGPLYVEKPVTFGAFKAGWLERYEQRVRPTSYQRTLEALKPLAELDTLPIPSVRRAVVEDLVTRVAATSPRQAQIALAVVKRILDEARDRDQRIDDKVLRIPPPRAEAREMRFLTWPEVERLALWTEEPYGWLVMFAAATGLRQGELFALTWKRVDLDARTVRVEVGAVDGKSARLKTTKARRTIHLTKKATAILRLQRMKHGAEGLVFPSPTGRIWRPDNFMARVYRPAVKRAGLEPLRFHDLRHTHISLAIAQGVNPLAIAAQVGHVDARLIFQRYGHLYSDAGSQAAGLLDGAFRRQA